MNIAGGGGDKDEEANELENVEEIEKKPSVKQSKKKSDRKPEIEIQKEIKSNETESLNFLAHQYFVRNEFDSCLEVLSKNSKSKSGYESPYSLLIKGLIKRAGGELENSLALLKQSFSQIRNTNDTTYIFKEIGKTFLLHGKFSSSKDIYEDVLKRNEDDWDCLYHLGLCYMNLKKFKESEQCLNKALSFYQCDEILIAYAKIYLKLGQYNKAIEKLEEALELSPNNTNVKSTLGTLYMKKNDKNRAMEYFSESMEINQKYSNSLMGLASIYQFNGNFEDALAQYKIAFSSNPNSALIWNNIGLCFLAKNKKIVAASCLNKALYLAPFEWIISFNLGLTYLLSEQYVSAYVHMVAASKYQKDHYLILMYLGIILTELNDFGNANNYFSKALSLKKDPILLFNYLLCLIKCGKLPEAKQNFGEFLKMYRKNESEESRIIEAQLQTIKKILG